MATIPEEVGLEVRSVFQSDLPLKEKLDRARTELLDLSARNRLLNMPRSSKSVRALEIIDEVSAEIFRLLVRENRPFTFVAGKSANEEPIEGEEVDEIVDLAQPEDDEVDERGVQARHSDTRLQTRLTPKGLQKRLLDLFYDARTLEEEQGVNILYLTLGALKWIDPQNAANVRFAPLVLIPVSLERGNAGEKFKLRARQEDYASNLSLEALLDRAHGIKLPAFEASDSYDPAAYFSEVADAVSAKPGWEVIADNIVLGFFSFSKFLMYRDLDPDNWPEGRSIVDRDLVRGLLTDGFPGSDTLIPEDANIDPFIPPSDMLHIVDSDSSQALAVHEVRRGRDLVIQGPPGTGKSQTIANVIASAIADGKTVLFVAEKMAALEVVKRRLDATGVGDACLEVHSSKANKRSLLEELRRTWELGPPRGQSPGTLNVRLTEARDKLNAHVRRMHEAHGASGLTPFQVVGQLSRLRLDGEKPSDIALEEAADWSPDDFAERHGLLADLSERVTALGKPDEHPWKGVGLPSIMPTDVDRLMARLAVLKAEIEEFDCGQAELAGLLEQPKPEALNDFADLAMLSGRVAGAPEMESAALANACWEDQAGDVANLVEDGAKLAALHAELSHSVNEVAWTSDLTEAINALSLLPHSFSLEAFETIGTCAEAAPRLMAEALALAKALGRDAPATLAEIVRLTQIGERVAAAPNASPAAFAADLWDSGVERAADLAEAIAELERARATIGGGLSDAAWTLDLAEARTVLASHGSGFLKIFSGDWRRSNRLVKSVLTQPDMPLEEVLRTLDALAAGQKAIRTVTSEEEFGRSAFGADWRGERSSSAPLLALVEWMRSLRNLGSEPRLIAARTPDKSEVGIRAQRTQAAAEEFTNVANRLWDDLDQRRAIAFGDAAGARQSDLASLLALASRIAHADAETRRWLKAVPISLEERQHLLVRIVDGQKAASAIEQAAPLGRSAFGSLWEGTSSNWTSLRDITTWISNNRDIRLLVSRIADRREPPTRSQPLLTASARLKGKLTEIADQLRLELMEVFGVAETGRIPIPQLLARIEFWAVSDEKLFQWTAYRDRADRARTLGCADVVGRLADGRLVPDAVIGAFEMAYYEAVYADQLKADPELGTFDGTLHGRLAREFADMDRQRISAASYEVVKAHHQAVPPRDGGSVGPLGVLRAEIARKRGHMPIRKLMEKAAPAIQALKPVFMMSPLSVAQFLTPGVFDFDLLVMDEASQIQPVDALGAVARAKQVVVVGDPKQLPPTAFFSKMTGAANDEDDDNGSRVADIESILGLFTARGLPTRMLRWHYRSKHQSLIAVSNRQFYENKLFIVPSPYMAEAGMGLRFHHIPQGIWDAGATRTNAVEAKIVAQAIIAHAREHPNLSLGVATFSTSQRRAILDHLELMRRSLPPEVESFFQSHLSEPFFVKNLENVQGDERDVIFISVGYGPTVLGGRVPMRFGPLGTEGGERRLNVLISRAKQRCEVFSSMTDEDIDPDFAQSRKGVFAFKLFMHFARTGRMTMAEATGRDHDSVFEEQVAKALQSRGYQVHRQVGLAGFFIDLAVSDPERPGRYLIGIECDGASYYGARSARERDRLRQSVLESHGWTIHRLWSTDWFQRPNEQLDLIVSRIEAAKVEHDADLAGRHANRAVPIDIVSIERDDVTEIGLVANDDQPEQIFYEEAVVDRPSHLTSELHDAPRGILATLAEGVVATEGPVHVNEVVNRLRDAWGLKRAGGRIQEAVEMAIAVSVNAGRLIEDGDFLSVPARKPKVRDRSMVRSASLRRVDTLPPAEIEAAIMETVRSNYGASEDQVCTVVSRRLGSKSTSTQMRDLISGVWNKAIEKEWLARRDGMLVLGVSAPGAEVLRPASPLATLIAEGEHERLEFKESLRWDVKAGCDNRKLEDVVLKTLAGFANRVGGTLLIGVSDGGEVVGLERDFSCLGGNRDKFELHLTNLFTKHFGQACRAARIRVSFPEQDGTPVCRVDMEASPVPVFINVADRTGNVAERFFVRSGNSTQELRPSEATAYIRGHFPAN
ncbi:DUF3320 domain-containing protein [Sphingobium sp. HWE2-09]|uniref:DUF3320 domain-containing protein n=1 Tax=Sphingobium sp. HWE2-09 TaxID=3108390 RepID=UPI002DD05566|nr:DUF3320 domain-containing protein [Sphingobium sp. HWE2-09]